MRRIALAGTVLIVVALAAAAGWVGVADAGGGPASVFPVVETKPVPHRGDAADDPAIWVHPTKPERSVVIGTDKKGGIAVYDLQGNELQYRADGDLNNVDLRKRFRLGGKNVTIVAAGDTDTNVIAVYRFNGTTRTLVPVSARPIEAGLDVYGLCMYRSASSGLTYVFLTSKSGELEQWRLRATSGGKVDASRVRSFDVGSQSEGCVADDELGDLYVGEEERGIWKYGAEPGDGSARVSVDTTGSGGHLEEDVEGLAIAYGTDGRGYLIASSQGNSTFVVYRREGSNDFVKSFRIRSAAGIDGAEDTDGIDVTTTPLGARFPRGLFVVQDGKNDGANQNFKLVSWQSIIG